MNGSGTLVGSDVAGKDSEDGAFEERVLEGDALELCALETGQLGCRAKLAGGDDRGGQFGSDDVDRAGLVR